MKFIKQIFIIALFTVILGISHADATQLPAIFPIYGYNSEENICQIKQISLNSPVSQNLLGDYWSLRHCRSANPKVIFHTGSGILIWLGIFLLVILFQYIIYPRLENRTQLEKRVFALTDTLVLGIILFFHILLLHYFAVPYAYQDYQSDIDHIIYMTIIRYQIPMYYAVGYLMVSFIRAGILLLKRKK